MSEFATMRARSTRTVLFGLFMLADRPLTAAQAIRLARPLRISATNVKSHLTRMLAEGRLRRSGSPRTAVYWPTKTQQQVVHGIRARLSRRRTARWDGRWLLLELRLPASQAARAAVHASLWFDGFRPWGPGRFIRPAWPLPWALDRARDHLSRVPGTCLHGSFVGQVDLAAIATLYRTDVLDREAARLARKIGRAAGTTTDPAKAFAARLLIGGRVAEVVGHDPRLPDEVWGKRRALRQLIVAYRRYDRALALAARSFVAASCR